MSTAPNPQVVPLAPAALDGAAGEPFSLEQKQYLEGFFAGAAQRMPFVGHTAAGQITADAGSGTQNLAALFHGTPVDDLCREELWKYERNPLDAWDELLAHTNENKAPNPENAYRFKYHGFFYVAPAQDSFMLRMRVPGAVLTAAQMRGIDDMAEDWGAGRADLTTRSNVQIRELQPKHLVPVLNKIAALGMSSRGSGADNIRNITASPLSGIDPQSLLDVRPYADGLAHYILNSRDLFGLPRKFNVAFDDGGTISAVADTNDIGFQAVRVGAGKSLPAGVYFRVVLCGITGHRQFATDARVILNPHEAVAVAAAMIRVFAEHGDRTDRKKARLKYLVDRGASPGSCKRRKSCSPFRCCGSPRWTASRAGPSIAPATSASMLRRSRGSRTWAWWCRWACPSLRPAPSRRSPTASEPVKSASPSGRI